MLHITNRHALASSPAAGSRQRRRPVRLHGPHRPRAPRSGEALPRAAAYIAGRFAASGWTVQRLPYPIGTLTGENLEVVLPGTTQPEEIVIVGAHYDSVPITPGADDNASGVAALLALADTFAGAKPARTLRFVAFSTEEPVYFQTSFMGSRVYARTCREHGDRIIAMLSLESLGYYSDAKGSQRYPFPLSLFYPSRGNFLAIVGDRSSKPLVQRVHRTFAAAKVLPVESAALPASWQGVGWSDHWSFWQEGYPAVMATDTAIFRNPHYHRATDLPDTLDYDRLDAAVRGLQAVVQELTSAPAASP